MKIAMLGWNSEMKVEDDSHCYGKMNWTKLSCAMLCWAIFKLLYTAATGGGQCEAEQINSISWERVCKIGLPGKFANVWIWGFQVFFPLFLGGWGCQLIQSLGKLQYTFWEIIRLMGYLKLGLSLLMFCLIPLNWWWGNNFLKRELGSLHFCIYCSCHFLFLSMVTHGPNKVGTLELFKSL